MRRAERSRDGGKPLGSADGRSPCRRGACLVGVAPRHAVLRPAGCCRAVPRTARCHWCWRRQQEGERKAGLSVIGWRFVPSLPRSSGSAPSCHPLLAARTRCSCRRGSNRSGRPHAAGGAALGASHLRPRLLRVQRFGLGFRLALLGRVGRQQQTRARCHNSRGGHHPVGFVRERAGTRQRRGQLVQHVEQGRAGEIDVVCFARAIASSVATGPLQAHRGAGAGPRGSGSHAACCWSRDRTSRSRGRASLGPDGADGPNLLRLQRRFGAHKAALVPRHCRARR